MLFANVKIRLSTTHLLLLTIIGQTVIMGFAWGFTGGILFEGVIPLSDHIVHLIVEYPTVLTLVVTLISTALSIITSMFFTFAVKEALGHHLSGPIPLVRLRAAIALSRPTWFLRRRFLKLSALTLAVYAVIELLNTSWSTLLLPSVLQWPVPMFGTELDLGSVAFANQLNADLLANGARVPAFEAINVLTLVSGIVAIVVDGVVETSPIFTFNGAAYNRSTSGVLPAIEEYSGASNPPSGVGLAFSGGKVPVNSSFDRGRHKSGSAGIAKNYTVTQQGVTANVTCQAIDLSKDSFIVTPTVAQGVFNDSLSFFMWKTVANCSGDVNPMTYFTTGNASGQMDPVSDGFLPVVVCPNPASPSFNSYKFNVFLTGLYKYDFLRTTVCEVVPYLTTVNVTYHGGIISVDRIATSSGLTDNLHLPLSQYIATAVNYQAQSNQRMTNNTIGNFLTAYGRSNVSELYSELEDYWRGMVEFASTELRSAYSATGDIPSNMTRPTSGTMYITTYGWRSDSHTFILVLVVITTIWGVTVFAAGYSLVEERYNPCDPSFDFSNPMHLVIAASGGGPEVQPRGPDMGQAGYSEDITVRFVDVAGTEGRGTSRRLVSA
ncbi:hypothetical protein DFH29DRAFT_363175 [Suillus ampliporus]|nr:hypothetical protein DFH29DRAFT_363175 [Suillus ampliporus]